VIIRKNENNVWGEPQNFSEINTEYDEESFFMSKNQNTAYFSSKGYNSMGGFDVFEIEKKSETSWTTPTNIGFPLNSSGDDLFFRKSDSFGTLTSIREGGKGETDIYWFKVETNTTQINGQVVDNKTNQPIENALIVIFNKNNILKTFTTDESGKYTIIFNEDEIIYDGSYTIEYKKEEQDYITKTDIITQEYVNNEQIIKLEKLKTSITCKGIVYDKDTELPIPNTDIILTKKDGSIQKFVSDKDGKYNFDIDNTNDLNSTLTITYTNNLAGYVDETKTLDTEKCQTEMLVYLSYAKIENTILDKNAIGSTFKFYNINFEVGNAIIKEDSKINLDKVAQILVNYPTLKIEISGHTDSRGTNYDNKKLSDERAKAAKDYIIKVSKIDENRITTIGYGEEKLLNKCANDVDCTEIEHFQNRRIEIKITDM